MTKAIVFTHFTLPRDALPIDDRKKRLKIGEYCDKRINNFADCSSIGLVYLFIAEGYQAILGADRPWEGLNRERILRNLLQDAIDKLPTNKAPRDRFQIVGTHELTPVMARLSREAEERREQKLGELLLGHGERLYYDSPKVVEAIIRLARAARPELCGEDPIFRFDADVDVDDKNVKLLLKYQALRSAQNECYFFSGGYRPPDPPDPIGKLLNGYAVRVAQFCGRGGGTATLMAGIARQFLTDLGKIGADPDKQVISGAGLYISPEAIRKLPPFANVGDLIVWIDDHLKRILHEELDHFRPKPKGSDRRCKATFVQDRYGSVLSGHDARWHREEYLRRLVMGCLLDGLIQGRAGAKRGPAAEYVGMFLDSGMKRLSFDLQRELAEPARERLVEIRNTWGDAQAKGTAVYAIARNRLPHVAEGHGLEVHLIREVIKGVDDYIELLGIWKEFVELCEQINPDRPANKWLFLRPVRQPIPQPVPAP